jgi:hypothetical protein
MRKSCACWADTQNGRANSGAGDQRMGRVRDAAPRCCCCRTLTSSDADYMRGAFLLMYGWALLYAALLYAVNIFLGSRCALEDLRAWWQEQRQITSFEKKRLTATS